MKITCVGGGPAGLAFALLMKRESAAHQVTVLERDRAEDTFGFGVVFSDATLDRIAEADPPTYAEIARRFAHWNDIDIHFKGRVLRSGGHGFSGLARRALLDILQARCRELGVDLRFESEVVDLAACAGADLVVAADGVHSFVRGSLAADLGPEVDLRPNRFVWLGTTFPYQAFTFYFKESEHGLFRVHAYRYAPGQSTFIVECTADTFHRTGLAPDDEAATVRACERLFAEELRGHRLLSNRSVWRRFPVVRNRRWHHGNVVLLGDAAHTAHFSIGSGTKLALEDTVALRDSLRQEEGSAGDWIARALARFEAERRPVVESLQRAAQVSLAWFEETERVMGLAPEAFAMSLLTRSLRVTHESLKRRDPAFVAGVDSWFAGAAAAQSGVAVPRAPAPPPMFTPLRLRGMVLENRVVVSPMCQYSAEDGTVNDWHLVHLGSRAIGGAGLVIAEMTDVCRDGRITTGCAGLYRPEHVAAWRRVVDFVHRNSRARIGVQLGHAGRKGATRLPWEGDDEPLAGGAWPLLAASPIPWLPHSQAPREMTRRDMDEVKAAFVRATEMAVLAGFDLVELHCAHGYLLASFISPLTNRRGDEYGGDLGGRMRYPLEVLDAVRAAWPAERPLSVRISATDWAPGGQTPADSVEVARLLAAHGCDVVDVSAGQTVPGAHPPRGRLFQTPLSERIRLEAGVLTMTVGDVSSFSDVNSILAAGRADLCVLARAHLFNPYWTRHAAGAQGVALAWPAPYRSMARYKPRFD